MKLRTLLSKCEYSNVKIGCKDGSGFIYCDTLTTSTSYQLSKISKNYLNKYIQELETKTNYMNNFDTYWETRIANLMKIKDRSWRNKVVLSVPLEQQEDKRKELDKKLKLLPTTLKRTIEERDYKKVAIPKRIKELKKLIPHWVNFIDREVVETYEAISIDEQDTLIILVKGNDLGKYVSLKEYRERKTKKTEDLYED